MVSTHAQLMLPINTRISEGLAVDGFLHAYTYFSVTPVFKCRLGRDFFGIHI
jgi:hypothetical protein